MATVPHANELRCAVRWMIRRDMEDVLDIENESFINPWDGHDFEDMLTQRCVIGMVAESKLGVVGFMVYELHKQRLHILNFAVAADCRRRGVGRQMVDKLKDKLSKQRRTRITLEIRESNLAGQLFFQSQGFVAVTIVRDFYEDTDEDAYLMHYRHRGEFVCDTEVLERGDAPPK